MDTPDLYRDRRRLQGRIAQRDGLEPSEFTMFALYCLRSGHERGNLILLRLPIFGDYRPTGWKLVDQLEVDWPEEELGPERWQVMSKVLEWFAAGLGPLGPDTWSFEKSKKAPYGYAAIEDDGQRRAVYGRFERLEP